MRNSPTHTDKHGGADRENMGSQDHDKILFFLTHIFTKLHLLFTEAIYLSIIAFLKICVILPISIIYCLNVISIFLCVFINALKCNLPCCALIQMHYLYLLNCQTWRYTLIICLQLSHMGQQEKSTVWITITLSIFKTMNSGVLLLVLAFVSLLFAHLELCSQSANLEVHCLKDIASDFKKLITALTSVANSVTKKLMNFSLVCSSLQFTNFALFCPLSTCLSCSPILFIPSSYLGHLWVHMELTELFIPWSLQTVRKAWVSQNLCLCCALNLGC